MRSTLLPLVLATLAASVAGCRQRQASGVIPRQRFVLANVELRSIPDTVQGDSVRRAALRKYHVSEADLRRFVDVHAHGAGYMARVWGEIADSVQKRWERTFPARPDGPPPGVGTPGKPSVATMPPAPIPGGPPQGQPTVVRGGEARRPPPLPNQPPPPTTEPPRPMVREMPPVRRGPPARPPDTHGPVTRPGQRPLAPMDTLDRRR